MLRTLILCTYTLVNALSPNALAKRWSYVLEDHFRPFVKDGITQKLFNQTLEGGSHVVFQHLNGSLMISDPHGYCFCNKTHYSPDIRFDFHMRRCRAMGSILLKLTSSYSLPDYEFVWSLDDIPSWAVKPKEHGFFPGFGAVRCWNKGNLAMPFFGSHLDFHWGSAPSPKTPSLGSSSSPKHPSLGSSSSPNPPLGSSSSPKPPSLGSVPVTPRKAILSDGARGELKNRTQLVLPPNDGQVLIRNVNLFSERTTKFSDIDKRKRLGKAVFRGGLDRGCSFEKDTMLDFNGDVVFSRRPLKDHCGRSLLLEQAKKYPDLIDYGGNNDTWISLDEQESKYRYVLSVEGFGGWTDRLYELLQRSMVVFDQDHPCDQWFEPVLKPYVHYVPIANDFRNLPGRVAWANNHPNMIEEIQQAADEWSREYLSPTGILSFMWASLDHYIRLVKYRPILRPSSVPISRLWDGEGYTACPPKTPRRADPNLLG